MAQQKASWQIINDLKGDESQFAQLLNETFNGIEYKQAGFSPYAHMRLMRYQLKLMLSRLELLQDMLDQEQLKPD
jgi:hypothetical protein